MAQQNWTYLGDHGKKFQVGLFHGPRTGHVLIHCNSRVVQVDFNVRESRTYSFFLDEELCEIELARRGDRYSYEFHINKQVDTPRNRERKKRDRKHWKQSLLFFGSLILCAGLFSAWIISRHNSMDARQKALLLETTGIETLGKVFLKEGAGKGIFYQYSFVANGKSYESRYLEQETTSLAHGMPLQSGDEFVVLYSSKQPDLHEIIFDKPSEAQLERYWQRSFEQHQRLNPAMPSSKIRCHLSAAYEIKGLAGLADFYFQAYAADENPIHNKQSYLRLTRDLPFQNLTKEKCL